MIQNSVLDITETQQCIGTLLEIFQLHDIVQLLQVLKTLELHKRIGLSSDC